MPSNTGITDGVDTNITTKQRTHDGDTTQQQMVSLSGVSGTEDAYTFVDVQAGAGTAANAIRVELPTDGTGVIASIDTSVTPGTAAANLGKAEDAGHTSGDVGVMSLGVRNDTRGTLASANLDYTPMQFNNQGDMLLIVTGKRWCRYWQ